MNLFVAGFYDILKKQETNKPLIQIPNKKVERTDNKLKYIEKKVTKYIKNKNL